MPTARLSCNFDLYLFKNCEDPGQSGLFSRSRNTFVWDELHVNITIIRHKLGTASFILSEPFLVLSNPSASRRRASMADQLRDKVLLQKPELRCDLALLDLGRLEGCQFACFGLASSATKSDVGENAGKANAQCSEID